MSTNNDYFPGIKSIQFEGPDSRNPLAFRFYDADRVVAGKPLKDHLKFACAYWHSFCNAGADPFGEGTRIFPWNEAPDAISRAKGKMDAAFEFMSKLGLGYFCFHDFDLVEEGDSLSQSAQRLDMITDYASSKMAETGIKVLWGTANLFSNTRYMNGAATNPDFKVVSHAAAQVKHALDATIKLNGENYVFWGGREGYMSLLNTDMKRELDHLARFLHAARDYARAQGFQGSFFIEPKPCEPSKHQYDYDAATCIGFLRKYGLENEVKLNLEQGHAILAGHSFEHELAVAAAEGMLGSIDMNRNDYQSGWDTDQFPNNVPEVALAYYHVLKSGGFSTGGTNFDAKLRRQSLSAEDLLAGHIGAMDICARGLKAAAAMLEDGGLETALKQRYADWQTQEAQNMLASDFDQITARVLNEGINPEPKSGRQEVLENYVNRFV